MVVHMNCIYSSLLAFLTFISRLNSLSMKKVLYPRGQTAFELVNSDALPIQTVQKSMLNANDCANFACPSRNIFFRVRACVRLFVGACVRACCLHVYLF